MEVKSSYFPKVSIHTGGNRIIPIRITDRKVPKYLYVSYGHNNIHVR